jgi:2-polyprenyl-3-methyl-5-hydroxy-6-metoxy-1,4-benzoquinol methylase
MPHLKRWLDSLPAGALVLDMGCGVGRVFRLLLARGCAVTGVDINEAAI